MDKAGHYTYKLSTIIYLFLTLIVIQNYYLFIYLFLTLIVIQYCVNTFSA